MGNEKRLFLLAVMTVLMSTAGYGQIYSKTDEKEINKDIVQKEINKEKDLTFVSVSENGNIIIKDDVNLVKDKYLGKNKPNRIVNISTNSKKENINNGTLSGNFQLEDSAEIGEKSAFDVVRIQNGIFVNNGTIKVSGSQGKVQAKGINITSENGKAINKGLIESSNGAIGVNITKGYFTNEGEIKTSGKGSIGIKADVKNKNISGINNSGIINVESGAIGISLTNNKIKLNNENGVINVSGIELKYDKEGKITGGTASIGIKIDNGDTENAIVNKGTINAIGGEKLIKYGKDNKNIVGEVSGVQLNNNAKFKNEGTIYVIGTKAGGPSGYQAKGININNANATAINTGIIIAERDGIGVLSKGNFTNENGGTIYAQNKGIGIQTATTKDENNNILPGSAVNKGNITVLNKGIGINILANTFAKNENEIITDGTGAGVQLTNGVFVNSGEINAGAGNAIVSLESNGNATNNTVYLKNGSKITGQILGAKGVDVLTLGTGSYSGLSVNKYEALTTRGGGDISVSNSTIALEYNNGTEGYLTTSKDKLNTADKTKADLKGNLSLSNSNLIIDIKNQNVDGENNNLGTMIDADNVSFDNVKFGFTSENGEKAFNVSDILNDATNGKMDNNALDYLGSNSTAIWTYSKDKDGDWIASKKTFGEASKSQVSEFAQFLDNGKLSSYTNELQFLSQGAFDKGMAQLSGGLHGYSADIAAVSSRALSNTMKERALTRDYLIKRPVSSWTQDVMYIDNNHRFGGLMDVDYNEKGVLGISEKQILPNGRVGLVYGGSSGTADAGESGSIKVDTAYFGGYYNHEFNDKWSLNSNANFVYTHNRVTRNVNFGEINHTFKSNYPTYTVGIGSSLIYTVKDDLYNKAHFYAGVDVNRIIQGTINEEEDTKYADSSDLAIRKKGAVNDKSYYSIVPSAGFMVQNTGYIFDKKYRIGADLNWETEVGNIKDGKRLHMKGLPTEYKIETTERENIFSYSLFGALNLTEDLAVNAKYTSMFSDEYDADMISAGFEYKMDTMGDNGIFAPLFYGIENHKPISDRWAGTFSLLLENEDDSDRTYYVDTTGRLVGGDYATSNQYKPKFTLSLNDKKSDWSYYFEGYLKSNHLVKTPKGNEEEQDAMRLHGEARWSDTYSKGKYGFNIGYRHEQSDKPYLSYYEKAATRAERGVHQLRLVPNFTYELGNGFTFGGGTTGIFEYNYKGQREGEMDFLMENQYGITYTGFMPKWKIVVNYFREDRWLDHDNTKLGWNTSKKEYTYSAGPGRYQLNQIRPSITYYFGNGGSFKFDARIPFGNGAWYNSLDEDKKDAENYEVRYGFTYYHPVTPGLTMSVGGIFVTTKTKVKDHNKPEYGDINRSYSFRPNIGFSYSF